MTSNQKSKSGSKFWHTANDVLIPPLPAGWYWSSEVSDWDREVVDGVASCPLVEDHLITTLSETHTIHCPSSGKSLSCVKHLIFNFHFAIPPLSGNKSGNSFLLLQIQVFFTPSGRSLPKCVVLISPKRANNNQEQIEKCRFFQCGKILSFHSQGFRASDVLQYPWWPCLCHWSVIFWELIKSYYSGHHWVPPRGINH